MKDICDRPESFFFKIPNAKKALLSCCFLGFLKTNESDKQIPKMRRMLRKCCLLLFSARVPVRPWVKNRPTSVYLSCLSGILMLVFDPGFRMWWAARIRSVKNHHRGCLEMLRNGKRSILHSLAESLPESLVKRALALGPRGPGRLITEAGNELMSPRCGLEEKAEQHT